MKLIKPMSRLMMVLIISLYSPQIFAFQFTEFRGHKLGDPPSPSFSKDCESEINLIESKSCTEDIHLLGGVPIVEIKYWFDFNQLVEIDIYFKERDSFNKLIYLFSQKYGERNYLRDGSDCRPYGFCQWGDEDYGTFMSIDTEHLTIRNNILKKQIEQKYGYIKAAREKKELRRKLDDL